MNDLVKLLRAYGGPGLSPHKACLLAAAKIERLQTALMTLLKYVSVLSDRGRSDGTIKQSEELRNALKAARAAMSENGGSPDSGPDKPSRPGDGETDTLNCLPSGTIVYPVLCVDPDDGETVHVFSTAEKAEQFAASDPRSHVLYDYALDCPERHEQPIS